MKRVKETIMYSGRIKEQKIPLRVERMSDGGWLFDTTIRTTTYQRHGDEKHSYMLQV